MNRPVRPVRVRAVQYAAGAALGLIAMAAAVASVPDAPAPEIRLDVLPSIPTHTEETPMPTSDVRTRTATAVAEHHAQLLRDGIRSPLVYGTRDQRSLSLFAWLRGYVTSAASESDEPLAETLRGVVDAFAVVQVREDALCDGATVADVLGTAGGAE